MNLLRAALPSVPVAFPETGHIPATPTCRSLNRERPHVGLLVLFGPEVRAFLYSGLAERLARHCRVSVITTHPDSAAFAALGREEVHAAPREAPSYPLERFRGWNRRLHSAWMETQGQARWRNQRQPARAAEDISRPEAARSKQTPSRKNCPGWLRTAQLVERSLAHLSGDGKSWQRLYEQLRLDCLIAADYASPAAVMALLAAARQDVATVVFTNSWKDVYAHPYVAAPPEWIGVSGQPEADHLRRASPHLGLDRIAVTGSLHLERFVRPGGIPSRAEFCRRTGLDSARPFLCYTAASPRVADGEESIVRGLLEAVDRHPAQPQVLLRLNPRADGERFRTLQARFAHCVVQKPRWEWDPNNDWNAPLSEDLDSWVATVHHAAFNVSVPSTVSLEFAAMGRLTLNVCFDAERQPGQASNARHWDAPFYRQIRRSPLVAGAFSAHEFHQMLACRLSEPGAWRLSPARRMSSPVDEAERLVWSALAAREERPLGQNPGADVRRI